MTKQVIQLFRIMENFISLTENYFLKEYDFLRIISYSEKDKSANVVFLNTLRLLSRT